ncbi:MAG TPA: helix-turn-helix domain-containing protein [Chloroflexota bacterium]|nr:helix-turn-helix domain-containing protein [Chloroflexota bacterium]
MTPDTVRLCLGEPAIGIAGWRLTHQQATAVQPIVVAGDKGIARYADQALLASMAQDDVLKISLRRLFLEPLERESDGGRRLKATLRAYFAAQGQVSSAAAALGVSRKTVTNHLTKVERRLEQPLTSCTSQLEAALALDASKLPGGTH